MYLKELKTCEKKHETYYQFLVNKLPSVYKSLR